MSGSRHSGAVAGVAVVLAYKNPLKAGCSLT